jgi:hypothetical protein
MIGGKPMKTDTFTSPKRNITRILAFFLTLCILVTSISPTCIQAASKPKLSATTKTLYIGSSFTLKVTGTTKKVTWSSNKKSVATVTSKGKVTAKQAGIATISAKVSGKTLKCKVTVKAKFSATEATKKISVTMLDTGKGVVAILKNNNKIAVSIDAKMVYYSGGTMIDTASDDNYGLESGAECAMYFHAPYDSNYHDISYDDYKISLAVSKIKVDSNFGADNVMAEVTNNSGEKLEYIHLSIIYYDSNNNAIGYDEHYAYCETAGSADYISFDFPYDRVCQVKCVN